MKPPQPSERQVRRNSSPERGRAIPTLSVDDKARFHAKYVRADGECWNWTGYAAADGRGRFRLARAKYIPSRVAWFLANGQIPEGKCVCHHCDNPRCVNPSHLYAGTNIENMADLAARRKRPKWTPLRGETATNVKVSAEAVRRIREDGRYQKEIAAEYGITQSAVSRIKSGENWAHI